MAIYCSWLSVRLLPMKHELFPGEGEGGEEFVYTEGSMDTDMGL